MSVLARCKRTVSRGRLTVTILSLAMLALANACGGEEPVDVASSAAVAAEMSMPTGGSDMESMATTDTGETVPVAGAITADDLRGGREDFLHELSDRTAPGFTLTDQHGERVALGDFRGRWVVMDWIYTNCMTVCPSLTNEMIQVRDALSDRVGPRVQLVSVTFDAERDDMETMKAHVENVTGDAPGWSWLTGTQAETDAVARAYGLSYAPAPAMMGVAMFDHTALTVVIDPDGRERHLYYGVGWGEDLSALLDELASPPLPAASDSSDLVGQNVALLSDTKVFDWAEWELDPGVSAQTLRVFPTADLAEEYFTGAIAELESSGWISMGEETGEGTLKGAYLIHRHPDGGHVGNGYNLNVMVEVEGKSFEDTRYTLVWMGGGFCC